MDQISQKQINKIITILEADKSEEVIKLINALKKADIIPAMYMMVYIKKINGLMKKCEIKNNEMKLRHDIEQWKKILDQNYQLELNAFIDTPEKFSGAFWLVYHAIERLNKFCDFDDSNAPPTKRGRCECEYHEEWMEEENKKEGMEKNPVTDLTVTHGFDEDSAKMLHDEAYYICKHCSKVGEEQDGGYPVCDTEVGE